MMKLNPGERQGWWSAKKFDRRIRMRALVQGAVNDHRTRILLDTGANVSVITNTFAKKLRLRDIPDHGRSIDIQGISEGKVSTMRRALVKITLGWEMVYEFEMWVMAHCACVDVVLGTDFMIPAGIRLDLFRGAAQLPNEVCIPLIKTKNMVDSMEYSAHVNAGLTEALDIPGHESREEGHPVSDEVPPWPASAYQTDERLGADSKYKDSQVLAYENCRDQQLFRREHELYEQWLATQPPSVERRTYQTPAGVMKRSSEDAPDASADRLTCAERWEKIWEQRERDEGRLDSWITNEEAFEIRFSGALSDGGSASDGDDSDTNEASAEHLQEPRGETKVINIATWVQLVSGVGDGASNTMTRETTIVSDGSRPSGDSSASYIATSKNEGTTTVPEEIHGSLKVLDTVASVRLGPGVKATPAEGAVVTLDEGYISVAHVLTTEDNEILDDTGRDYVKLPRDYR
ncbi:hypothetical protein F444_01438 [Phytophthora nicotianae P1976]|uniref:Peptidase A2 domain-containing protein n=1 Tax=Phytophthora nicotianae P1976 TaxID=1317066 RepID=A0A081B0K9_PHYNI|nr:hypothetical protein F444_01438 [Phytophthora nicotianae P1976]